MKYRVGTNGVHLFDRYSGTNILLDEFQVDVDKHSKSPRQVSVALTNTCDLHCPYCYAPKHKASLNSERLVAWLKELDSDGCLGVGFGGGEPLLHPDFVGICQRVSSETQLAVTFTTHGHRLNPRLVDKLKGSIHFSRVSIDGVGGTYENLRGKPFSSLLRSVDLIASLSPFGINVVVNEKTITELDAISQLANDTGASEILLLPQQQTSDARGMTASVGHDLNNWVSSYTGKVRLAVSEAGAVGLPVCNPQPDEAGLQAYAHIDASGNIRSSSYSPIAAAIGKLGVLSALEQLKNMSV